MGAILLPSLFGRGTLCVFVVVDVVGLSNKSGIDDDFFWLLLLVLLLILLEVVFANVVEDRALLLTPALAEDFVPELTLELFTLVLAFGIADIFVICLYYFTSLKKTIKFGYFG